MIAVESTSQKGTLRIHQPAQPHQLEKPSQTWMETISWRFTVLQGGRPGKVPESHTEQDGLPQAPLCWWTSDLGSVPQYDCLETPN